MKKSILLVVLVLVLSAMTAAPGVATPGNGAEKTTVFGYECFDFLGFQPDASYTGETVHVRGGTGHAEEFVWDGLGWVRAGTNETTININAKGEPDSPIFTWEFIHLWGTFDIDLGDLGHFTGTWSDDKATGKEVDGRRLVKVDLDPPAEGFPAGDFPFCEPLIFTVIDPGR